MTTRLDTFNNSWYQPGSKLKITLWYVCNALFLRCSLQPFSFVKIFFLRLFGAKIGEGVVIKPSINVKYPWKLTIGNYVWIGENVWIDNLDEVVIGNHVCISQGALLLCGNHNYKKSTFDLLIGKIILEDGVWIGAQAVVCGGITCASHSMLSVSSVTAKNLEAYSIYRGNPAEKVGARTIS
ncbi:MAG: WcaF family extracellular polysaccharide biosynthesis acetyltransferase [Bacteroidia bacterium]